MLPDAITEFFDAHRLPPGAPLLLAASGGLDSTVLAHLLAPLPYPLALAHVNYGLRGQASDGDEAFVRQLGEELCVPVHVTRTTAGELLARSNNVQNSTRNYRYEYFEKILDEYGYSYLISAHHLDDNLETLLANLIRGTGLRGLRGMGPERGRILRPLLSVSRAEIEVYAREAGLDWREDATNATDRYQRNRIRHRLLPVLRELGLTDAGLAATFHHLRAQERVYDHGLRQLTRRMITAQPGGGYRITRAAWRGDPALALTVLRERFGPGGPTDEEWRQLFTAEPGRRRRVLGWDVTIGSDDLLLEPPRPPVPEWGAQSVNDFPATVELPFATLRLDIEEQPEDLTQDGALFLRPPTLPLLLRPRQNGDRLRPRGMAGHGKKLSRIFIDGKVPQRDRDRAVVICSAGGHILGVTGGYVDAEHAVRPEDRTVLAVRVTPK